MLGKEELPEHYIVQKEPSYSGRGVHSVASLENICEQYKEYAHQQNIIKYALHRKLSEKQYTKDEVLKLLIEAKDRFKGSDLQDYISDSEVIEWFENKTK